MNKLLLKETQQSDTGLSQCRLHIVLLTKISAAMNYERGAAGWCEKKTAEESVENVVRGPLGCIYVDWRMWAQLLVRDVIAAM